MTTYDTPHPIRAVVDVGGVLLTVRAGADARTTVDLRPHHPGRAADVELARRTKVHLAAGRLVVRSPRTARSRLRTLFGAGERVDLDIALPAGSTLQVRGWGDVTADGPLDDVDIDTAMGDIDLDRVLGQVRAKTSMGDVRVNATTGPAHLRTSAGSVHVGWAGADVTASTSAGDVRVDEGTGDLRLVSSAGDVRVGRAAATVTARTVAGDVRLGSVCCGAVVAQTSYGQLEIGVAAGSAAWLDAEARHGVVRSELEQADGPREGEDTVEIRATTGHGDIVVRRA